MNRSAKHDQFQPMQAGPRGKHLAAPCVVTGRTGGSLVLSGPLIPSNEFASTTGHLHTEMESLEKVTIHDLWKTLSQTPQASGSAANYTPLIIRTANASHQSCPSKASHNNRPMASNKNIEYCSRHNVAWTVDMTAERGVER